MRLFGRGWLLLVRDEGKGIFSRCRHIDEVQSRYDSETRYVLLLSIAGNSGWVDEVYAVPVRLYSPLISQVLVRRWRIGKGRTIVDSSVRVDTARERIHLIVS